MSRALLTMLTVALLAGCSGEYLITFPDVVAATGEDAAAVARLQRREVLMVAPAVEDAVVVMWADPDRRRAAHTDGEGYASALVPVPDQIGRHDITLRLQDERGDEAAATGRCYVMQPNKLTIAVDWEAIEDTEAANAAAAALAKLTAAGVQIVYAAEGFAAGDAHAWLAAHGLPDGPVLSWGYRRNWYWRAQSLAGSLPAARDTLGGLLIVAAGDDDLGDAAAEMNMIAMGVGIDVGGASISVADWAALAERVLVGQAMVKDKDMAASAAQVLIEVLPAPAP